MVAGTQSNEGLVKDIINIIQSSDLGWTLKRAVQDELSKSFVNVKDIKRLVPVSETSEIMSQFITILYMIYEHPLPYVCYMSISRF